GVAYRVSAHARLQAARRRRSEVKAPSRPASDPLAEVTGRDLCAAIDAELASLSERYRAPLLLCFLEGKTRDEAARALGWSLATLKRRLQVGRDLLRARLARRGLTLSGAALAALLAGEKAPACPPPCSPAPSPPPGGRPAPAPPPWPGSSS